MGSYSIRPMPGSLQTRIGRIIFCHCGYNLRPDEDILNKVNERFETLIVPYYVLCMRTATEKKHGEQHQQAHHWKAKNAYKRAKNTIIPQSWTDVVVTKCPGIRNKQLVVMRPAASTWTTSTRSTFPTMRPSTRELAIRTRLFLKAVTQTFKRVPWRSEKIPSKHCRCSLVFEKNKKEEIQSSHKIKDVGKMIN